MVSYRGNRVNLKGGATSSTTAAPSAQQGAWPGLAHSRSARIPVNSVPCAAMQRFRSRARAMNRPQRRHFILSRMATSERPAVYRSSIRRPLLGWERAGLRGRTAGQRSRYDGRRRGVDRCGGAKRRSGDRRRGRGRSHNRRRRVVQWHPRLRRGDGERRTRDGRRRHGGSRQRQWLQRGTLRPKFRAFRLRQRLLIFARPAADHFGTQIVQRIRIVLNRPRTLNRRWSRVGEIGQSRASGGRRRDQRERDDQASVL